MGATLIVDDQGLGIIRYSFVDPGGMEDWVGLAMRGDWEIYWYDLHGDWTRVARIMV